MDDVSFGAAYSLGVGTGIAIDVGLGSKGGRADAGKKIGHQLQKAIADNQISVRNNDGESLTVNALFNLLNQNYKRT